MLTVCSNEPAAELIEKHNSDPSTHFIQKYLAKHITTLVHDEDLAHQAESLSETLFSNNSGVSLSSYNFDVLLDSSRFMKIIKSLFKSTELTVFEFLKHVFLEYSNNQIKALIKSGAIRINRQKIISTDQKLRLDDLMDYNLINNGKTSFFIIKLES